MIFRKGTLGAMKAFLRKNIRKILRFLKLVSESNLNDWPGDKLMAVMRHDAHRIEKSVYNDIYFKNLNIYKQKKENVLNIIEILRKRGVSHHEPTLAWAKHICDNFDDLKGGFIEPASGVATVPDVSAIPGFIGFLKARRSVRVWSEAQPDEADYKMLALQLIDAARWAPTSGNRQPWRFKILTDPAERSLLAGVKEGHCISAPLLIFIGMDSRIYGAFGANERGLYIDAGAAIMSMILTAHRAGFGTCWNHFADDLIASRENNSVVYKRFCEKMSIPDWISPVAILAVGCSAFTPPTPARMDVEALIISEQERA